MKDLACELVGNLAMKITHFSSGLMSLAEKIDLDK